MTQTHPINRKILRSVSNNVERLKCGSFEERDVKELLIDLREFAREVMKSLPKETNEYNKQIHDFVDICDFIAHTYREKGIIERNIREYAKTLHEMLSSTTIDKSQLVPKVKAIDADKVVNAMLAFACIVLSAGDKSITNEYFLDVFEYKNDIALCLLSLLQDSIIELDHKEEGHAFLHILPFEGRYRLYCQVIGSRIDLGARARGAEQVTLGWPVIVSSTLCIDDDVPSDTPQGLPAVFETFRDAENKLRMRVIR